MDPQEASDYPRHAVKRVSSGPRRRVVDIYYHGTSFLALFNHGKSLK